MKKILITGGAGYIGSHTAIALIEAGYTPIIIDNFSNSEPATIDRISAITGKSPRIYVGDCGDREFLRGVFEKEHDIAGIIHFAAHKAVGESLTHPLRYYKNNLLALLSLLEVSEAHGTIPFVFSSSANVYGDASLVPTPEHAEIKGSNSPYGRTKVVGEMIVEDKVESHAPIAAVALRYFNPIGAHPSGKLGELPLYDATNVVPLILKVASGEKKEFMIFGDDHPTPDGTPVRDFIHVMDLAEAHIAALDHLTKVKAPYYDVFNVGTGHGSSILHLLKKFEHVSGAKIAHKFGPRREGDISKSCADVSKIERVMGWKSKRSIDSAVEDAWKWHNEKNSDGKS